LESLGQKSDLLNITEDEEDIEFKHCFQTRLNKESVNERIRAPLGMWKRNETFIDNDLQSVFNKISTYYA
jgi:hypothetical protein